MRILIFFIVLLFSVNTFANPSFLVAPGKLQVDLSRPSTHAFIVTNTGTTQIRLRIKPVFLPIDSPTMKLGRHLNSHIGELENLSRYILVSPGAVSLKPGTQRTVRISIRPPLRLPQGEYRAHLLFSMIKNHIHHKHLAKKHRLHLHSKMQLLFESASAIYGSIGKGHSRLKFHCERRGKDILMLIKNLGHWHFDGNLKIVSDNHLMKKIDLFLLRNSEQDYRLSLPQAKSLKLAWHNQNEEALQKSTCHIE